MDAKEIAYCIKHGLRAKGIYTIFINGKEVGQYENLVPDEGLIYLLKSGVLGQSQISNWYVALFSGNVNPSSNWTASNFASVASEITSSTEGYSETSRPQWVPNSTTPTSPTISNSNAPALFSIACTTSITISGAALLSSPVKGGTSGVLLSAVRYPAPYTMNNGSSFSVQYDLVLQDV